MYKIDRANREYALKPLATAMVLALTASGAALAEPMFQVPLTRGADMTRYDSDYVELGAGYQSQNSYQFGEFSGLYKEGGFFIGNFNMRKRFGDNGNYLNAFGYNLGQDSRQLGAEGGRQGTYWLGAGFDQLTRYQYDDTEFIHTGLGGSNLTLPSGCGGFAQPPTATASQLDNCLHTYEIKQTRKIGTVDGGFYIGNWKFSVDYRQDDQTGNKRIGAVMGSSGGNPRSAILPYQLDGTTSQITARANWTTKQAQADISFWYSKFNNNSNYLAWQDPYTSVGGTVPGTGYPTGYGRLGLMPDNDFWQLQGTGAWNFTPTMRLTGTLSYSVMRQNETFLPYTINTTQIAAASPNGLQPLPRSSLNGEIKNTLFDLRFTARPLPKLSVNALYQYRKQDNNTPQDFYAYPGGDVGTQPGLPFDNTNASSNVRLNPTPGQVENKFKIDGDYSILQGTLLRGWYQYTRINYNPSSEELRSYTDNNEFAVELRKIMSEKFTGWLRYTYDQRRGSDFSNLNAFEGSYTSANVAASNNYDNLPTTRQFFVADYNKNLFTAVGNFSPMPMVSIGVRADWYKTDFKGPDCGGSTDQVLAPTYIFPSECQGRNKMTGTAFTLDGSVTPAEGWNTFAFYTYQTYSTNQDGRNWSGSGNPATRATNATNAAADWSAAIKQYDNTFGLGVKYQPFNKKWDAGATYIYSSGTGSYSLDQVSGAVVGVPDNHAKGQSLQLYAKYELSKNLLVRLNYWYQSLSSNDFAYDYTTPSTSQNVVLTGHQSPTYRENIFGISFAYTNW